MEIKTLPVNELRQLLAGVSEHGSQHLQEVETDLTQANDLLNEAIEKLSACFMGIHQAVTVQQEALHRLIEAHGLPADEAEKLLAYREQISEQVNAAVTSMQFQDLTNQLITRSIKRVNGLQELLVTLADHGEGMPADGGHEEVARLLEEMSNRLTRHSHALQGGLRQAVNQQHMNSGDIELFLSQTGAAPQSIKSEIEDGKDNFSGR